MPSALSRPSKARFASRRNPAANRPQPTTPILAQSVSASGSVLTIVFNQAVTLKGVPQYTVDIVGATPVSAVMTSPTVVTITYSAAILGVTTVTIPYEEPAIRNTSGGFVANHSLAVA